MSKESQTMSLYSLAFEMRSGEELKEVPAWWTVKMELVKEYDPEYFANSYSNPMSDGAGKITQMQIDIIMNSKVEDKLEMYAFYFNASAYFTEVQQITSIGIIDHNVRANTNKIYGNESGEKTGPFNGYGDPRTNKGTFDFKAAREQNDGVFRDIKIQNTAALLQPFDPAR